MLFRGNDLEEVELLVARLQSTQCRVQFLIIMRKESSNTLARTPHNHVDGKVHMTNEKVCKIFNYVLDRTSLSV